MSWWKTTWAKYQTLIEEYGTIAFVVYFSIFGATLLGFFVAIQQGFQVEAAAGQVGTFWGAYAATKLTQPLRIGLTLVVTPMAAKLKRRVWPSSAES